MKTVDVVCIGASLLDISTFEIDKDGFFEREPNIVGSISFSAGGDATNQSIVLSHLGHKVKFITKLGSDDAGNVLYDKLEKSGVDMSLIARGDQDIASVCNIILIGKDDTRVYITNATDCKSSIASFCEKDIDYSVLTQAKVVSIGSLFVHPLLGNEAMTRIFKTVKEAGGITCADVKADDLDCSMNRYSQALPYLDFLFANEKEAKNLTGLMETEQMADYFLSLGIGTIIIKLGGKGCFVKTSNGDEFFDTPFFVDPVDTTGAGDNFMAGFISGLIRGCSIHECVQYAKATSAICVGSIGASTGVKSMEQVFTFIKKRLGQNA